MVKNAYLFGLAGLKISSKTCLNVVETTSPKALTMHVLLGREYLCIVCSLVASDVLRQRGCNFNCTGWKDLEGFHSHAVLERFAMPELVILC